MGSKLNESETLRLALIVVREFNICNVTVIAEELSNTVFGSMERKVTNK
jgi:hypothetical protein